MSQGNVNVGNNKETLLAVVAQLLPYIGYPRTLNAISCINEIIPEKIKTSTCRAGFKGVYLKFKGNIDFGAIDPKIDNDCPIAGINFYQHIVKGADYETS